MAPAVRHAARPVDDHHLRHTWAIEKIELVNCIWVKFGHEISPPGRRARKHARGPAPDSPLERKKSAGRGWVGFGHRFDLPQEPRLF